MSHLGGTKNFARKGGRITQKRGWGWCRNDGVADFLLLYSSITFTVCVYRGGMGSKVSFITFWFFILLSQPGKILIQVFIVLKHCIICIFLIHSDSLVHFLSTKARCFLILKMFWCLNALPYFFSSHFWSEGVKILLTYKLRNITKQNWH